MKDERENSFEDELLDRALSHRRVGDPRPGLETRVLARLQTAPEPRRGGWLLKACAVAVPAISIALVAVYMLHSPATVPTTTAPEPPRLAEAEVKPAPADQEKPTLDVQEPAPPVQEDTVEVARDARRSPARTQPFPSRDALSPQEALLVRFVRNTPTKTLLEVAEAPQPRPLKIEKLHFPRLRLEPLPKPDPLSAS